MESVKRRRWRPRFTVLLFLILLLGAEAFAGQESGTLKGSVKVHRARHSGDVIVYLHGNELAELPPPEKHAMMDQKNQMFTPHVLPVQKGTTVDFPNSDKVRHNVFSPRGSVTRFNLGTYAAGVTKSVTLDEEGEILLLCNVHAEMSGYILVLPSPFFTVSDRDGDFSIQGIPPGRYTLKTWHEKRKSISQDVEVPAGGVAEVHLNLTKRR